MDIHIHKTPEYIKKEGRPQSEIQEFMVNPAFHWQKLTVWAALLDGKVFGPYFIEKIMNAKLYRAILSLFLTDLRTQGFDPKRLTFQQAGASPHTFHESIQFLDRFFHRTFSARPSQYVREYLDWPSRSPSDINDLRHQSSAMCIILLGENRSRSPDINPLKLCSESQFNSLHVPFFFGSPIGEQKKERTKTFSSFQSFK